MPRACNSFLSSRARARVKSFSRSLAPKVAPLSSPPCAGSIITKNSGAWLLASAPGGVTDGVGDCPAAAHGNAIPRQRIAPARRSGDLPLFQCIDGKAAQQFGIKVRGFLGQHLACKRDITDLLNSRRVQQEGGVCTLAHAGDGFEGVALVSNVFLVAHGLLGNSQYTFKHDLVELYHVQVALP